LHETIPADQVAPKRGMQLGGKQHRPVERQGHSISLP
jgi:hypothetical protein